MNICTLFVTNYCQLRCSYCPIGPWRSDDPGVHIDYTQLLKYMGRYLPPDQWCLEVTGGEPSTTQGFGDFLYELGKRGYRGIIRSNGMVRFTNYSKLKMLSCWHTPIELPPRVFDEIYILKNPGDDWESKVAWCQNNNIPYSLHVFNAEHDISLPEERRVKSTPVPEPHFFVYYLHIGPAGYLSKCCADESYPGYSIQKMSPPVLHDTRHSCRNCLFLSGTYLSLDGDLRERVRIEYGETIHMPTVSYSAPLYPPINHAVITRAPVAALGGS